MPGSDTRGAIPLTTSIDAERAALAADQSVLEATGELDRAFSRLRGDGTWMEPAVTVLQPCERRAPTS